MRDIDTALSWGAVREDWKALKVLGPARLIYAKLFYRHHMRWLHKRNRHVMRRYGPMFNHPEDRGAPRSFDRCDWCGHTIIHQDDGSATADASKANPVVDTSEPTH